MLTSINLPQPPKVIKKQGNLAVFEIKGYYPGYGLTIGNALRRALLSSLPGAAIVAVKIEGVNHEFSTLPYVAEDMIRLILNFKQIRLKLHGQGPQKMTLKVKGIKKVTAADIKAPSSIEIANLEAPIATLTHKKAQLSMEIEVDTGLGYIPAEQIKKEKLAVGLIVLDAIFTPIRRVSFNVEQMRVGERTDYDLLRLEIETDGTIKPEEALKKVSSVLVEQFNVFAKFKEKEAVKPAKKIKQKKASPSKEVAGIGPEKLKEDLGAKKIEDLKLSAKVINVLEAAGIKTAAGLTQRKAESLRELPGIGERSLQDIKRALGRLGLTLK